ncbi:surfeit locus protein 6 [Engraulis encrasicolus]|uniref:surfeit locus protein 6 n=1 Tax=Engraulis encrasicolus TaxID=184585 RepID=UPI002FD3F478
MTSLAAKYDYLEKYASKVVSSQQAEPRKRPYVPYKGGSEDGPSKKKNKQKQTQGGQKNKQPAAKTNKKPNTNATQKKFNVVDSETPKNNFVTPSSSKSSQEAETPKFFARDILRQRLHQKIEENRKQGPVVDPSSEEVKKRRERRKQERERKKRKKKEFRAKQLAAKAAAENGDNEEDAAKEAKPAPTTVSTPGQRDTTSVVFSKVEVGEEYVEKSVRQKEKRKQVKGGMTPLTGKNYKQLLSRVQARNAKLEELREKDPAKAQKEEEKMKWTNLLYKAEGLKIKDNEDMLKASLKKKEQRKSQVKKKWTERSQNVLEKMQHRQDKRRKNLQRRKQGKVETRKQKARKKGRVLPEDLKKAKV